MRWESTAGTMSSGTITSPGCRNRSQLWNWGGQAGSSRRSSATVPGPLPPRAGPSPPIPWKSRTPCSFPTAAMPGATPPSIPVIDGKRFQTLQIPTTWPTADELLGENGITPETINDHYLTLLKPGLNVHTIHAEMEGGNLAPSFADLLERLLARGYPFRHAGGERPHSSAATPVKRRLIMGELPGRAGRVAIQQ